MLFDFDPDVVGYASQPFWLTWMHDGERRSHAPDFFLRLADGTGVVVDCRPAGRIKPRDEVAFEATRRACRSVGWRYRLVHEPDVVFTANVRWLAGYRHPRHHHVTIATRLIDVCREPRQLFEAAELAGNPVAVLPVMYHLMWRHVLATAMTRTLSETSVVTTAAER